MKEVKEVKEVKDEDIPIWGSPIDPGALTQIKICARTAERVALMADHHKGYSCPIGGVVAYKGQISPSCVGYDIACFVGEQEVALVDGRQVNFLKLIEEDLLGKENFVYSMDKDKNVVVDKLESPRQTGVTHHIVNVYLDNGSVIRSTPEHQYLLKTGDWIDACSLSPDDLLMSLYLKPKTQEQREQQVLNLKGRNHRVVKVEHTYSVDPIPVYCLTAPRHHIFALSAGVFVHNCGNKAVLTDANANDVRKNIGKIMDDVCCRISFGVGRTSVKDVESDIFNDESWKITAASPLKDLARKQLGTVGSGNHYVDIFSDEQDRIWVGCHFGSRGLGYKIAKWFLEAGGAKDGMDADPLVLDVSSDLGSQYLQCMTLAGKFAYAGRDFVCSEVADILGANIKESIHNHHNYAWLEKHGGEDLWVVRKGATPAFPHQKSFIGGSLGDISVIVEGLENSNGERSLYSTVHGAGRVMGRMDAKGKFDRKTGACIRPGRVSQEMLYDWVKKAGVELRGAGVDESPHCYKRITDVLQAHNGMIKVLHTLKPIGVAMAGEKEIDPYKD